MVIDAEIESKMLNLGGGMWQCTDCHLTTKSTNLRNHIESKHVPTSGHYCLKCGKFCKSKNALITHNHRFHNKLIAE